MNLGTSFRTDAATRGQRLDQALVARFPALSRTKLQELIKTGRVQIGGAVVRKPGMILIEECEISVELGTAAGDRSAPSGLDLSVAYEDEHIVAVDKPAGVLSHANSPDGEAGVAEWAEERYGKLPQLEGEERAGIAHRLDRDTSGLLLVARTLEAMTAMKAAFAAREIAKTYLALVHGVPRFDSEWIESWLGRATHARDRISVMREGEGRAASTYYETRERYRDFAWIAAFPKTGRMHQVRVHLASVGHPIIGDSVYKPLRKHLTPLPSEAPQMKRHALHAHALDFAHPVTGEKLHIESPLPPDMAELRAWLRVNRPEREV